MALHESEQKSLEALAAESAQMQRLTQELHKAIMEGRPQGTIINIRPQATDAPQKLRVQSKG